MSKHLKHVEHDEWGRPVVYLAEYQNSIYGSTGIFTSADAAIFFVVTGLSSWGDVEWSNFPTPGLRYPNEERNGNEDPQLNPLFVVERKVGEKRVWGKVTRTAAMDEWTVGNGIAESGKAVFFEATGRDIVELSGEGDHLSAKVGGHHLARQSDMSTTDQIARLIAERDLLLFAIAPEDYAKIQAKLVAISESPDSQPATSASPATSPALALGE